MTKYMGMPLHIECETIAAIDKMNSTEPPHSQKSHEESLKKSGFFY